MHRKPGVLSLCLYELCIQKKKLRSSIFAENICFFYVPCFFKQFFLVRIFFSNFFSWNFFFHFFFEFFFIYLLELFCEVFLLAFFHTHFHYYLSLTFAAWYLLNLVSAFAFVAPQLHENAIFPLKISVRSQLFA